MSLEQTLEYDVNEESDFVSDKIADLVEFLVISMVDEPDEVTLDVIDMDNNHSKIEVNVADADVAKVIGRGGRTINSIRTLARALAAKLEASVEVDVLG